MSNVHIYTAPSQPATRFNLGDGGGWIRNNPRRLIWCKLCAKLHWAKYMVVQVFYDGWRFWCAPGHGCAGTK